MPHKYTELRAELLQVEQPARYTGGEFQLRTKPYDPDDYHVAVCFPDLYEIGMSNTALRILYDLINSLEGVSCERVFTPAPDFEEVLRSKPCTLYTLEHGIPLNEMDLICVSVGYELSATNMLSVLELGNIPLLRADRGDQDPLVIAGGPAVTNPLPFAPFLDGVFIGEAENGLQSMLRDLVDLKLEKAKRKTFDAYLLERENIWREDASDTGSCTRAIDLTFTSKDDSHTGYRYYTVPTLKPVQDNGVVEIMRGCPNGCRFCHAGELYKPFRQRSMEHIVSRVEQLVDELGYRDITLSSLSSGDHPQLHTIITGLNSRYAGKRVSFSLPSLKVTSFSLDIIEAVSAVRKSGLTFAIETPLPEWQSSINKVVPIEQVIEIILKAKQRGWRVAKFYFMVGLPFVDRKHEADAITEYIERIQRETGIQLNITIGVFIPKPHTPFQWAELMSPEESAGYLSMLKRQIQQQVRRVKVNYHDPAVSFIEGMISRGDKRVAQIILEAYREGARLDAWDEHFKRDVWQRVIDVQDWDVETTICSSFSTDEPRALPWHTVTLASTHAYLLKEYQRAESCITTSGCDDPCPHYCGVCRPDSAQRPAIAGREEKSAESATSQAAPPRMPSRKTKVLFRYRKVSSAIFHSHINVMHLFEKSCQRAGIDLAFTEGYNPKPIMEFAQPLPIGIAGTNEYMTATILHDDEKLDTADLCAGLNRSLAEGFEVLEAVVVAKNMKRSLTAAYHAADYRIAGLDDAGEEVIDILAGKEPNVMILSRNGRDVILRITEAVKFNAQRRGEGQAAGTGNLMKLIAGYIPKYSFLGKYETTRIAIYADAMEPYGQYYA